MIWYQPLLPWPMKLFAPLSWIYRGGFACKAFMTKTQAFSVPVICVGNITLAGNGKTPLVMALAAHLGAQGYEVHIITRGYKATKKGPLLVTHEHTAQDVGDEALLLASCAPTWIGTNRKEAIAGAIAKGADIILSDDGFQNRSFAKDLSLVVIDGANGFGNEWLLPLGPMRESMKSALERTHALIIIDAPVAPPFVKRQLVSLLMLAKTRKIPIFTASRSLEGLASLRGKNLYVYEGLGGKEGRFATLLAREGLGAQITKRRVFPDHHAYTEGEAKQLLEEAKALKSYLVTTQKDLVRLRHAPEGSFRHALYDASFAPSLKFEIEGFESLEKAIAEVLVRHHGEEDLLT